MIRATLCVYPDATHKGPAPPFLKPSHKLLCLEQRFLCTASFQNDRLDSLIFLQNFPGNQTPILSPPVTLLTEALQFTETGLANDKALSGTSVPQPLGPILGAQEERMRQVSFSGGYLYSCEPF